MSERVAALVYDGAFLPRTGKSLLDLTKLPEGDGDQVLANVLDGDEAGKIRLLRLSGIGSVMAILQSDSHT